MLTKLALCCVLLLSATSPVGADEVPFTTIVWSQSSEIREPRRVVIRAGHEWIELWREHQRAFPPDGLKVNFSRSMVIGVFRGFGPSTASGISIWTIERDRGGLIVHYGFCQGLGLGDMIVYPFHLVAVPRVSGPVRFREEFQTPLPPCPDATA